MSRDVPFDEKAICDGCGALGAFDFMGDFFCPKCLAEDDTAAQQSVQADACPACRGEGFVGEHKQNRCKECSGTGKRR